MKNILYAIRSGKFLAFGINEWNDLLKHVFGKINRGSKKYHNKEGFKLAIKTLKEFREKFGRLPLTTDKEIRYILYTIRGGKYLSFGITNWNEMLLHIFGEVNFRMNLYVGKKGLETAVKELREYKKKTGKLPTSKLKQFGGISNATRTGRWKDFGIDSWKKIIDYAFREESS